MAVCDSALKDTLLMTPNLLLNTYQAWLDDYTRVAIPHGL